MKSTDGPESEKRRAGESAAEAVRDGWTVGLGTGSTATYAIRAVGRAVQEGLEVTGVPTSLQSRSVARAAGVPLCALEDVERLDLAIDGADQVADGEVLKGAGAAHAREKVVAAAADRFLVVVDSSKLSPVLDRPVPVEVLPDARTTVAARLRELGGDPQLREAGRKDGPVVTEHGGLVLDCAFGAIESPRTLAEAISGLPGVVEHGLFVGMADEVHVGTGSGVERRTA